MKVCSRHTLQAEVSWSQGTVGKTLSSELQLFFQDCSAFLYQKKIVMDKGHRNIDNLAFKRLKQLEESISKL